MGSKVSRRELRAGAVLGVAALVAALLAGLLVGEGEDGRTAPAGGAVGHVATEAPRVTLSPPAEQETEGTDTASGAPAGPATVVATPAPGDAAERDRAAAAEGGRGFRYRMVDLRDPRTRPRDATLVGRVVDRAGQPVPDTRITLTSADWVLLPTEDGAGQAALMDGRSRSGLRLRLAGGGELELGWDEAAARFGGGDGALEVATISTDPAGRFEVALPGGEYRLSARASGFAPGSPVGVQVPAGAVKKLPDLVLHRATVLTGRVLAAAGAVPLPGARVTAWLESNPGEQPGRVEATSGPDGAFRLEGLREGVWAVEASADGYVPARASDVPVTEARGGEAALALARAGRLEGVLRRPSGEPCPGGYVFVYQADRRRDEVQADGEGRYRVTGLPPGPVELFARSGDYGLCIRAAAEVREGELVVADLVLAEGARIEGKLVAAGGAPAAGLTVVARSVGGDVRRQARSGADGAYLVEHLYPGRYTLAVFGGDRARGIESPLVEVELEVVAGPTVRDFVVPQGASASGVVVGPDGRPLAGANVIATQEGEIRAVASTGREGTWRLDQLAAGSYDLFVRHPGRRLLSQSRLELAEGAAVTGLRVQAHAAARLRGRVTDERGAPVGGLRLEVRAVDRPVRRDGRSDDEGRFAIDDLYDGAYELFVDEGTLALAAARARQVPGQAAPPAPDPAHQAPFEATSPRLRFEVAQGRDVERDLVVELAGR